MIQERILREFIEEQQRAKEPGYVSRYDDVDFDEFAASRQARPHVRSHPTTAYTRPSNAADAVSAKSAPSADGAGKRENLEPSRDGFGAGLF